MEFCDKALPAMPRDDPGYQCMKLIIKIIHSAFTSP